MTSSASPPTMAPGDRVRRRSVSLGAVPTDRSVRPSSYPDCRQPGQHAADSFLESRLRDVLEERDGPNSRGRTGIRIPDDPDPPRGRSRSVSSKTADAARIKETASHNRRKLLSIHESAGCEDEYHAGKGAGAISMSVGYTSRLDSNRAVFSSLRMRMGYKVNKRRRTGGLPAGSVRSFARAAVCR